MYQYWTTIEEIKTKAIALIVGRLGELHRGEFGPPNKCPSTFSVWSLGTTTAWSINTYFVRHEGFQERSGVGPNDQNNVLRVNILW